MTYYDLLIGLGVTSVVAVITFALFTVRGFTKFPWQD